MKLPRWPVFLLPTLLFCTALADGYRPSQAVFPKISLNTSLLRIGLPHVTIAPSVTVADQNYFYPAYLDARFSPSLLLPVSDVAKNKFGRSPGVVMQVHSVAALLALPDSGRGPEIKGEIETLRAINAGTLNPATLIPPGGQPALRPFRALPSLFNPSEFQWAAGAVRRMTLPGGLRGVRYLVIRAGDTGYLPAEMTEYTFQGLSADGRFYVTLTMPYMLTGVLSEAQISKTFTKAQLQTSDETTYNAYALNVERKMDADTQAPKILLLDALVNSIRLR